MLPGAPQADKSRVKDYIHRLDNFDGPAVGEIAVGYEMFDEAFEIYKKFGLKTQAIKVLLEHHEDLDRALEYALKVRGAAAPAACQHPVTHTQPTKARLPQSSLLCWRTNPGPLV